MSFLRSHLAIGAAASVISIIAVMLIVEWEHADLPVLIAFSLWPAVPMTIATIVGWILQGNRAAMLTCTAGGAVGFGVLVFLAVDTFAIHPDPQGGLILIFGPIYAFVAVLPFLIAAALIKMFARKRQRNRHHRAP